MHSQLDNDESDPSLSQIAMAGAGSGIVASYVPVFEAISTVPSYYLLLSKFDYDSGGIDQDPPTISAVHCPHTTSALSNTSGP